MSGNERADLLRAFAEALERLTLPDRSPADDDAAAALLVQLFDTLVPALEWQALAQNAAALRAAGLIGVQHLRRLDAYEGYAAVRSGKYDRGVVLLRRAAEDAATESDARFVALNGLAQADWFQTAYDRALVWFERLHDAAREAGNRTYQGVALVNMGMVYNDLGQPERALDLTLRSLDLYKELGDRRREAYALYEIGNNALLLGRWELAQRSISEAITRYEELTIVSGLAALYWGRGFLAHLLGDEQGSAAAYEYGLRVAQQPDGADPNVALDIYTSRGLLHLARGELDAALGDYEQAVVIARDLRHAHWLALAHYRRGDVLERLGRVEEALDAYRIAITQFEDLRGATQAEEVKIGLVGAAQQPYEAIILLLLRLGRVEEAFHYVERARSRAFLDMLAQRDSELAERFDQPVATLAEVQAALAPGALLLEYVTTGVLTRGEALINRLPPASAGLRAYLALPAQTWVFAVTRDGLEARQVEVDPNTLRPPEQDPGPGRRLLRERLLVSLYDRLIAPLAHLLDGRELLYIVPHGPLHYVAFMALRDTDGAYLVRKGGPALALAPSATVLVRNCLGRAPLSEGLSLALGYNDHAREALRYAVAEAEHVARRSGGVSLTGDVPRREPLIAAGPLLRRLHIAGHAIYNPRDPLASELRLGPDESLSARAIIGELRLNGSLVTLSACTSGLSHVVPGDELLGLQRAFLYAGATTVVCTLWEASDLVALLVMDRFYEGILGGVPPAAALRDAQTAVREMTGRDLAATLDRWRREDPAFAAALGELPVVPPEYLDAHLYEDPYHWAPFMLIGRPDLRDEG
jgi:CHAT domain-containing protein